MPGLPVEGFRRLVDESRFPNPALSVDQNRCLSTHLKYARKSKRSASGSGTTSQTSMPGRLARTLIFSSYGQRRATWIQTCFREGVCGNQPEPARQRSRANKPTHNRQQLQNRTLSHKKGRIAALGASSGKKKTRSFGKHQLTAIVSQQQKAPCSSDPSAECAKRNNSALFVLARAVLLLRPKLSLIPALCGDDG